MELTKRLNLPCYCTPESWHYTIDKRDFKDACIKNNVPVAKDYYLSEEPTAEELESITYPVVVKAIDQSANRGMSYCFSSEEISGAIKKAKLVSNSDTVVIERMLKGHEYTAWYALAEGKASLINFAKMYHKDGYPSNCYSITTTYTDNLDLYLKEVDKNIKKVFSDIGCKEGIAWIEMMLDEDGHFYVIEMGYRMSGDMMALVHKNVCNFNSYGWLLDIAVVIKHTANDLPKFEEKLPESVGCSYILWSKKGGTITKWDGFETLNNKYNINVETTLGVGSKVEKHQLKKLGKLIVLSITLAVAFYGLIVFAIGYGMNSKEILSSVNSTGLVAADAMAKLFHSELMAKILIFGGICGIITSWNSFLIGGSRALESMASSYMIPHVFFKKHKKYQTPYIALIFIGILSIVSLFFGRQMLVWISNCASFACCLTYCIVSLSFLRIRKNEPELARPYKVKHYRFVGWIAVLFSGFLSVMYLIPGTVCSMTKQEIEITFCWVFIGLLFGIFYKTKYKNKFGNHIELDKQNSK